LFFFFKSTASKSIQPSDIHENLASYRGIFSFKSNSFHFPHFSNYIMESTTVTNTWKITPSRWRPVPWVGPNNGKKIIKKRLQNALTRSTRSILNIFFQFFKLYGLFFFSFINVCTEQRKIAGKEFLKNQSSNYWNPVINLHS